MKAFRFIKRGYVFLMLWFLVGSSSRKLSILHPIVCVCLAMLVELNVDFFCFP